MSRRRVCHESPTIHIPSNSGPTRMYLRVPTTHHNYHSPSRHSLVVYTGKSYVPTETNHIVLDIVQSASFSGSVSKDAFQLLG